MFIKSMVEFQGISHITVDSPQTTDYTDDGQKASRISYVAYWHN